MILPGIVAAKPAGGGGGYTAVLNDDNAPVLNDDNAPVLVEV